MAPYGAILLVVSAPLMRANLLLALAKTPHLRCCGSRFVAMPYTCTSPSTDFLRLASRAFLHRLNMSHVRMMKCFHLIVMSKAREYKLTTVKRLFLLSSNQCAEPNCTISLMATDEKTIIAKICHIEAAGLKGARYNSLMTDDDRRSFSNLLLLCDEHHSIIDNPENEKEYPKELLWDWKTNHENKSLQQKFTQHPSLLFEVINFIANSTLDDSDDAASDKQAFKIREKIDYNNIIRYKTFIDEYKVYYGKIDKIYKELDQFGSKKERLFRSIRHIYLKIKSDHDNGSSTVADADEVIEEVEKVLLEKIQLKGTALSREDIEVAVVILVVDAFIRCKILEKPPVNYVIRE